MATRKNTRSSVRAALKKARRLIQKGWTKGTFHSNSIVVNDKGGFVFNKDGSIKREDLFCAIGAIREVDGPSEHVARRMLIASLAEKKHRKWTRMGVSDIYTFNDARRRTQDEVVALFDRAIEMVDEDIFAEVASPNA